MSKDVEVTAAYRLGELNERKRIRNLLGEFGMKLETEVSDGDNYSLGRYNAISEFIAILDGETNE
jgi:hypothetical protein